jgi:hypothetical protein
LFEDFDSSLMTEETFWTSIGSAASTTLRLLFTVEG